MFFAFAGYARIATLGEEVKDPARVIPRAILGALAGALVIYLLLGALLLAHLPVHVLASSTAPLLDAVERLPPGRRSTGSSRQAQPLPRSAHCWPSSPGSDALPWPWPANATSPAPWPGWAAAIRCR